MSADPAQLLASAGRALLGPVELMDGAALDLDVEALPAVGDRRASGTRAWTRWSYRWVQGRWAVTMRDTQGRMHRPDDASTAFLVLAPARFLPPAVWEAGRDEEGTVVLQHRAPAGPVVVWRLDAATGVVREASAGEPGRGQAVLLQAASGVTMTASWSDEVAAAVGLAFVRRRDQLRGLRVAGRYEMDGVPLTTVLERLLVAGLHEPGPDAGQAAPGIDVRRFGDRISWTTPIVEHRLGVVFADLGSSRYLGAGMAGAVIDVRSGAVTHAVEGAGRHRWHVTANEHTEA